MERDLLIFIVIILIVLLIIGIIYRIIPFITKTHSTTPSVPSSQRVKEEYRGFMEKIKSDYERFQEQHRLR